MKVLSIKEPYATLIKDSVKIYETRSWKTNYRGEIYIHASLTQTKSETYETAIKYLKSEPNPGYILCLCKLVDCIPMTKEFIDYINRETKEAEYGRYSEDRYAWKLELIEVLNEPIKAKGKLGIWNYKR
ncbi:MAG: ASCH domain-containing protein [Bacilli bacterium]|nr:ASCH domain-containing protein [Bacilli bacterium]